MSSMFPYENRILRNRAEFNGPSELIVYGIGAVVGGYIGLRFGSEFVELANQITQDPSTIETIVKNHPLVTKLVTCAAGVEFTSTLVRLPGKLIDKVIGTYHKSEQ